MSNTIKTENNTINRADFGARASILISTGSEVFVGNANDLRRLYKERFRLAKHGSLCA